MAFHRTRSEQVIATSSYSVSGATDRWDSSQYVEAILLTNITTVGSGGNLVAALQVSLDGTIWADHPSGSISSSAGVTAKTYSIIGPYVRVSYTPSTAVSFAANLCLKS
jgi:hypothetical protein